MKSILNNILLSFTGGSEGYSAKKLSAFALILIVIAIHIKWLTKGDFTQLELVLTIDYGFIAALFGLGTYQSIKNQPKITTTTLEKETTDDGNTKQTLTAEESSPTANTDKPNN